MVLDKKDKIKYQLFIAITLAILFVFIGFFAYMLTYGKENQLKNIDPPPLNPKAQLGEVGAECGGDKRLPCRPGNSCLITNRGDESGVCVNVDQKPGLIQPF